MRGVTHALLGAAVTVPIALNQSPGIALGCLVVGAVGGGGPDWIDFRSGLRKPFVPRHRGASHGLPALVVVLALLIGGYLLVADRLATTLDWDEFAGDEWGWVVLSAFAVGWLSHLASDACTIAGIQPLLPFFRFRMWLVPRAVRSRSDGYLDKVVRLAAIAMLGFGLVLYVARWWAG